MDRFAEKFAHQSGYVYAGNNPISNIDINGDSTWIAHKGNEYLYENGKLFLNGSEYTGKVRGFLKRTTKALDRMSKSAEGSAMLNELSSSTNNYVIKNAKFNPNGYRSEFMPSSVIKAHANQFATDPAASSQFAALNNAGVSLKGGSGGTIFWNTYGTPRITTSGNLNTPFLELVHEMFHGLDANRGLLDDRLHQGVERTEWQAVYRENIMRSQLKYPMRLYYIKTVDPSGSILGGSGPLMLTPGNKPILPSWV